MSVWPIWRQRTASVEPDPEGWLATAIWRICLDNDEPISVPASRWAAATAIRLLGEPVPRLEFPPLCVELHEATDRLWDDPPRLARALRGFADGIAL